VCSSDLASLQNPGGISKAAKFQAANPLGPIANPFEGLGNDEQNDYQKELAENINERLVKTMKDLQDKHAKGQQELDDPDRAPTGEPYQQVYRNALQRKELKRAQDEQERQEDLIKMQAMKQQQELRERNENGSNADVDDDEYDSWLDEEDDELQEIRNRRLQELRAQQMEKLENIAKGHGQYRQIPQDDFLPECTSSRNVVVHFFHSEFERCKIMDHHIKIIAELHTECKFLKMDSEKAPFFVNKLQVKTLPTVLVFCEGKTVARLVGFQGLASDLNKPDEFHTGRLQEWLAEAGAIDYKPPAKELEEEMEHLGLKVRKPIYSGGVRVYDEDS